MCGMHNTIMILKLNTKIYEIPSHDSKKDRRTSQLDNDMNTSTTKRSDTGGLETSLTIAQGAQVKLTTNIDVSDGLANGARGIVKKIIIANDHVQCILVKFDNPDVGKNARIKTTYQKDVPACVPIERHGVTFMKSRGAEYNRTQFPLMLAWACNIHSIQGLTVDQIVVNMTDMFDYAHAYVAFSRVHTMGGLQILNRFEPAKIRCDPKIVEEMDHLKEKTLTTIHHTPKQPQRLRIIHLNVRGYLANL